MRALNSILILIFATQTTFANDIRLDSSQVVQASPANLDGAAGNISLEASASRAQQGMIEYKAQEYNAMSEFDKPDNSILSITEFSDSESVDQYLMSPAYNNDLSYSRDINLEYNNEPELNIYSPKFNFNYRFDDDSSQPCGSLDGFSSNESIFKSFLSFGSDYQVFSSVCKDYLEEFDSSEGLTTKLNSQSYCGCVGDLASEESHADLSDDDVLNDFQKSFYQNIIANRVTDFLQTLRKNAHRYQDLDRAEDLYNFEAGDFGCTEDDIDSMAKELNQCFEGPAAALIDEKNGLKDEFLFLNSKANNRISQIFKKANEEIKDLREAHIGQGSSRNRKFMRDGGDDERVKRASQKFSDLIIVGFAKNNDGTGRFPDEYLSQVRDFLNKNPLLRQEFQAHKQRYVDMYNIKKRTDMRSQGIAMSPVEKTIYDISDEHEKHFAGMFAQLLFDKTMMSLGNRPEFKNNTNYKNDIIEGITQGNPETFASIRTSMADYLASSYEENMGSCSQKIQKLKESCDPANAKQVMTNVSAQEFIDANSELDNDSSVKNSKLYCEVLNRELIDTTVANSRAGEVETLTPQQVYAEVKESEKQKVFSDSPDSTDTASGTETIVNTTGRGDQILDNSGPEIDDAVATSTSTQTTTTEENYNFSEAANLLDNMNSSNNIPDSNVIDGNTMQAIVSNPNTSVEEIESVKDRIEREAQNIEEELEKSEESVSAAQVDENNALKKELDALRAQISELNSAIASRDKKSEEENEDNLNEEEKVVEKPQPTSNNFAGFGSGNNVRRDNAFAPQQASRATTGSAAVPTAPAATSSSSFSSAGQGLSAINKLGATGGLGLSGNSGSSRAVSGTVSNSNIAKSDQRLVAEAISNGNTSVVLTDGRVYYIGQDEEGNVILSETAEEVMAGVMGPEQEGPQLPKPKAEDGPKREIASEKDETAAQEESIYSKFLDAAEISE
ncbi:hypothetical protein [Halobacteriovorax sp.]|uniref:hypothetical protein n=1 Tax=Halobacteriovorax sp. TaxID=2020862 RepID=UPI003AF1E2E0